MKKDLGGAKQVLNREKLEHEVERGREGLEERVSERFVFRVRERDQHVRYARRGEAHLPSAQERKG
jgi:hypothetical protein